MFLETLNETLWIALFLPLFALCALALLPRLPAMLKRRERRREGDREPSCALRPSQAAGTVLAATVGTGNIVGTAQAIAMGGPGAVFWMWVAALLGCAVKAGEIYFGSAYGGAMQYIRSALGRLPAALFAALALLSTLLVGNMAQINASVIALDGAFFHFSGPSRAVLCLGVTALTGLCLCGGISSAGKVCAAVIPPITLFYVLGAVRVLYANSAEILPALRRIVLDAFSTRAALGAAAGLGVREALLWGLRRGAFSNEAGLGSAANIHACTGSADPAVNARWGLAEVFADTLGICTLSALTLLCSGVKLPYGALPGPELMGAALASAWGTGGAALFLAFALFAFGFSTVLGCYVSGQRCASWLGLEEKRFRLLYLLCCLMGGLIPLDLIWRCADAVNVLLAAPNLLSLLLLSRRDLPLERT